MHVCYVLYKYGWPISGFYSYFRELFLRLAKKGEDVSVVSYQHPNIPIPDEAVRVITAKSHLRSDATFLLSTFSPMVDANAEALRRTILRISQMDRHIDLIHSFHREDCAVAGIQAARQLGCPFIYTPIGNLRFARLNIEKSPKRVGDLPHQLYHSAIISGKEKAVSIVCRLADGLVVPSNHLARQMIGYGANKDKIRIVPFAVDTDAFKPCTTSTKDDSPTVMFLGRLNLYQKAVDDAVRAFSRSIVDFSDARFLICGDGPDRHRLMRMCVKLGIGESTKFLGWVPYKDLPAVMVKADVMLMPFKSVCGQSGEGFGRVLVESMACGIPIVTTSVPPIDEVVEDQKNGVLVPQADIEGLSKGVCQLLRSRDTRRRMGKRGRNIAMRKYSFDVVTSELHRTYLEMFTK